MKTMVSEHRSSRHFPGFLVASLFILQLLSLQALLAGCGDENARASEQAAARAAATNPPTQKTSITLVAGTDFMATLQSSIATDKNHVGDRVVLRISDPVSVNGRTVVPVGATINGSVTHIDPAGSVAGGAELTLRFEELVVAGENHPISCNPFRLWVTGDAQESVLEIGGGAIAGSIIGGILGGQKGAIQGAVVGGAVGAGVAVITPGKQLTLQEGLLMKVTLVSPVVIRN